MRPGNDDRRRHNWRGLLLMVAVWMQAQCAAAVPEEQNGMILISARRAIVGTDEAQRRELAKRFDCHPTWLNDDLPRHEVALPAYWIDRFPVTNAQYLAFVEATGHPRPAWWGQWRGAFPGEYHDHPVAGVSGKDAAEYAKWAGKRLPSAEEWEVAMAGPDNGLFAWGDAWPGPVKFVPLRFGGRTPQHYWELPSTRPVGKGDCGRSAAGVEDFAGQVLEWVADTVPHHGSQFRMLKGASWFQEDPLNFRVASGWFASETWQSALSGFRCALDGDQSPPKEVPRLESKESIHSLWASGTYINSGARTLHGALAASGGTSRHLSIHPYGREDTAIGLMAPETVIWNGASVVSWRDKPDIAWTEQTPQRAAYVMRLPELRLQAEFVDKGPTAEYRFGVKSFENQVLVQSIEQRFTATNLTEKPGSFRTSTCLKLQSLPMFYDCEQLRTFALDADGKFVPARRLARGGDCVRWVTRFSGDELDKDPRWAVLAVVSRDKDKHEIIASARAGQGSDFTIGTNTLFTCLHTDSTVQIPPRQEAATRQLFWFVSGNLDDLLALLRKEQLPSDPVK